MTFRGDRLYWWAYTSAETRAKAAANLNYRYKAETGHWPDPLFDPNELLLTTDLPVIKAREDYEKRTDGQYQMIFDGSNITGYKSTGTARVKEVI